ncbi:MAG: PilZ domain-containing protein [Phycisphaera sp.]|nr:MAG: PilZ domain-containing protein [Phycisphaera sp.]
MQNHINRRKHDRFTLSPMYSRVTMRMLDQDEFHFEGHAYDISESGLKFEMDRPVEVGSNVMLRIDLPLDIHGLPPTGSKNRYIEVLARIAWLDEEDIEVGPAKMAAEFLRFVHFGDKERLIATFCTGRYMRAA